MRSNIFIPKQINVGFQKRSDTYTQMLAYIIYFDEKGVLRKEPSWNIWRDVKIPNQIVDNVPTEGFVLNKQAGGYSYGWQHRQAYIRVYDPRGFEFEIEVENLLYILDNCNAIKGKGLEGKFVYGWDSGKILLLPLSSPDYIKLEEYNTLRNKNSYIKGKDLVVGATYLTLKNTQMVYLGRFDVYDEQISALHYGKSYNHKTGRYEKVEYETINHKKHYWFYDLTYNTVTFFKSVSNKFIKNVDSNYHRDMPIFIEKMETLCSFSPIDINNFKFIEMDEQSLSLEFKKSYDRKYFYYKNSEYKQIIIEKYSTRTNESHLYRVRNDRGHSYYNFLNNQIIEDTTKDRNIFGKYKPIIDELNSSTNTITLSEIVKIFKPLKRIRYLVNGKIYDEGGRQ